MVFACVCGCFLFSPLPMESSCCWLYLVCSAPAKPLLKPKSFLKTRVDIDPVSWLACQVMRCAGSKAAYHDL